MTGPKALGLTALPGPWRFDAACTPRTGDLFFLAKKGNPAPAKETCRACPVRLQCLTHAIEHHEVDGSVWGGFTMRERGVIVRSGMSPAEAIRRDEELTHPPARDDGRYPCPYGCEVSYVHFARLATHLATKHLDAA